MNEVNIPVEADDTPTDDTSDDADTTLRTRIVLADGRDYEVRERFSTVKRYTINANKQDGEGVIQASTGPRNRIAVPLQSISSIEEIER